MALYKVTFEFLNEIGEWKRDCLDNNGDGYTLKAATEVAMGVKVSQICAARNVQVELMEDAPSGVYPDEDIAKMEGKEDEK